MVVQAGPEARSEGQRPLYDKLELKESVFADWLDRELVRRADHDCVDTMAEFRRATVRGDPGRSDQVRGRSAREERQHPDRRPRVVRARLEQRAEGRGSARPAQANQARLQQVPEEQKALRERFDQAAGRGMPWASWRCSTDWAELDWESLVKRIAGYEAEKKELEGRPASWRGSPRQLAEVGARMEAASLQARRPDWGRTGRTTASSRPRSDSWPRRGKFSAPRAWRTPGRSSRRIADRLGSTAPVEPEAYDRLEVELQRMLTERMEAQGPGPEPGRRAGRWRKMRDFRQRLPGRHRRAGRLDRGRGGVPGDARPAS